MEENKINTEVVYIEKDISIKDKFSNKKQKEISKSELERISPLTLAYLGDTVYESYIREYLIKQNVFLKINDLHKSAIKYVSANAQSKAIKTIEPMLTEDEIRVFKRGRNHKKTTSAKNASVINYRHATGFEALIGYLYLKGDIERLDEIVYRSIEVLEKSSGVKRRD